MLILNVLKLLNVYIFYKQELCTDYIKKPLSETYLSGNTVNNFVLCWTYIGWTNFSSCIYKMVKSNDEPSFKCIPHTVEEIYSKVLWTTAHHMDFRFTVWFIRMYSEFIRNRQHSFIRCPWYNLSYCFAHFYQNYPIYKTYESYTFLIFCRRYFYIK